MPAPYFTTNDSDIGRLEGLYIKERKPPIAIQGVSRNRVAVAGATVRGPIGVAVEVGSVQRFLDIYGPRNKDNSGTITNMVWKFLLNKQFGGITVVRAAAAAAA